MLVLGVILGVVLVVALRRDSRPTTHKYDLTWSDYPDDMKDEYWKDQRR